jgi:hypothetical protein
VTRRQAKSRPKYRYTFAPAKKPLLPSRQPQGRYSYCGSRCGTSFSIRNSLSQLSQVSRPIMIVSICGGDATTVSFPQYRRQGEFVLQRARAFPL